MRRFLLPMVLLAMSMTANVSAAALSPEQVKLEADAWFAGRIERLTAPTGWLSLVGLHWVESGMTTVGTDAGNDITIATGPAQLGKLVQGDGKFGFVYADAMQRPAPPVETTRFDIVPERSSLELIERGDRRAIRIRDAQASTRIDFAGIDRYPVDAAFRVQARFEPHAEGTMMGIANVTGSLDPTLNPGVLHFEVLGKPYRIEALEGTETELFLLIADRTSGRETYGGGRMIYVPMPVDGMTEIDFNRAYNPPCAFTAFSTCPLPPPENRLNLVLAAGEKKYVAAH